MTTRIRITLLTITVATVSLYIYGKYRSKALTPIASVASKSMTAKEVRPLYTRLPVSERQHVLDGEFALVRSTDELPEPVKNTFATLTKEDRFALADLGHKYQETDVIEEPGLPSRRLVIAGHYKQRWFVHYAHGGIGLRYAIIVLDIQPDNTAHFVWGGSGFRSAANLNDLRNAIKSGEFADDVKFYW